ncbi:MAG: D-alanyl-D-alanine carboxypeptidase/D-alanyl-D-alanine-endopeptidase [Deltaproteobacteria bacterium]|nr:D-alanyl-D-alanine carboxypeptidase/D-alanyl-D-alanine-endopeptidase [Deltaproteobacteria bacterium]
MKKIFPLVFLCLILFLSEACAKPTWKKNIEKILESEDFKKIEASILASEVESGKPVFSHSENVALIPASNTKLITTVTALNVLGPYYKFKTEVFYDGKNLYVKGYGDPLFVTERLWFLVNDLSREDLKSVHNLVLDDSYFDDQKFTEGWVQTGSERAYSAPLGALSLNFNVVAIYVRPAKLGGKPKVIVDPASPYVEVQNLAVTGKKGTFTVDRFSQDKKEIIKIQGIVPESLKEKRIYKNIANPLYYYGSVFKTFLEERNIKVKGSIQKGIVPPQAKLILTYESKMLREIASALNLFSNNFIAEQIVKTMGAYKLGAPGSTEKGLKVMDDFLTQKMDFKKDSYVLPEENGTLARFDNTPFEGSLRAKTGSLNGVMSLTGFLKTTSKQVLAFSIILNSSLMPSTKLQESIDKILGELREARI